MMKNMTVREEIDLADEFDIDAFIEQNMKVAQLEPPDEFDIDAYFFGDDEPEEPEEVPQKPKFSNANLALEKYRMECSRFCPKGTNVMLYCPGASTMKGIPRLEYPDIASVQDWAEEIRGKSLQTRREWITLECLLNFADRCGHDAYMIKRHLKEIYPTEPHSWTDYFQG